jgi:protein tyrosine phosphatase
MEPKPQPFTIQQSIPANKIGSHIAKLNNSVGVMMNTNFTGWDVEYMYLEQHTRDIPAKYQKESDVANLENNQPKNRYLNVLPFDETRVVLADHSTDYINANWINGAFRPRQYIACQGPLLETTYDFWKMVWEQNVYTIVMLTREEEREVLKCSRYWPIQDQPINFSCYSITYKDMMKYNMDIHIRYFIFTNKETNEVREIVHYQYVEWPDFGAPSSPTAFMSLVHQVDEQEKLHPNSPLCVHCSAGIGRTGTFFTVHIIITQLRQYYANYVPTGKPFEINIIETILKLREQRSGFVQTKDQYCFIYNAIYYEYKKIKNEFKKKTLELQNST